VIIKTFFVISLKFKTVLKILAFIKLGLILMPLTNNEATKVVSERLKLPKLTYSMLTILKKFKVLVF
jgi:hypothetical protein